MDSQMETFAIPLALDAEVEKTLFNAGSSQLASFLGSRNRHPVVIYVTPLADHSHFYECIGLAKKFVQVFL